MSQFSDPTGGKRQTGFHPVDEAALVALVRRLPLERKARLLAGADNWSLPAEAAIGLRPVVMSDGPNGVRGLAWGDERNTSLLLPNVASMAASWDEGLFEEIGAVLAAEARRKGVDILLGPGVNLHRSPLGGRNFEYMGEDPWHTARLAAAYVRGVQGAGVAACVKHYVLNEMETERKTYDVEIDERTLREVHLLPFEMAVKAGAASLMAAYNRLGGVYMTANRRLDEDILKGEWGFDGALVSDWFATWADKAGPVASGLDITMPGPDRAYVHEVIAAVEAGRVAESVVDDHVLRVLRLAARVGGLLPAPAKGSERPPDVSPWLRRLGARSMTLLRNAPVGGQPLLPLSQEGGRLAVIGPMAARPTIQGGGSSSLTPARSLSPLAALREALGGRMRIDVAEGTPAHRLLPDIDMAALTDPVTGEAGLRVRLVGADGAVLGDERRRASRLLWAGASEGALPAGTAEIGVTTRLAVAVGGEHRLALTGCGRVRLRLGEADEREIDLGPGTFDNFEMVVRPHQVVVPFAADAGAIVDIALTRPVAPEEAIGFVPIGIGYAAPAPEGEAAIAEAVALAKAADVVLLLLGNTEEDECEGYDRPQLALPGRQDELAAAVLAANPRTVVVMNASSPVLMPWIEAAPAVLWTGFGGQEYGGALVEVLTGRLEPAGRLTATFPCRAEDVPVLDTTPTEGRHVYAEGLACGYRGYAAAGTRPLFPFGHGLGYGRWNYLEAAADANLGADPADLEAVAAVLTVVLRNDAGRAAREVVQVYAEAAQGDAAAAPLALAGFAIVEAGAGESVRARVAVPARALARYGSDGWEMPGGGRRLRVGRSAGDLRLTVDLPPLV